MPVLKICTVRDRAVDAFGQPIFVNALGAAIRSFSDEINRTGSTFNQHPEDYDLYEIGEYNDQTAQIFPLNLPRQIAIGKDCVRKEA